MPAAVAVEDLLARERDLHRPPGELGEPGDHDLVAERIGLSFNRQRSNAVHDLTNPLAFLVGHAVLGSLHSGGRLWRFRQHSNPRAVRQVDIVLQYHDAVLHSTMSNHRTTP
jgi:hypothetical protein